MIFKIDDARKKKLKTDYKDFIVESFYYQVNQLTHAGEIIIGVASDSRIDIDELISYILHFYPIAQFSYETSYSEPMKIRVELGEAGVFDFANRIASIGTEKGDTIRIRFDYYEADTSYGLARRYIDTDIAATKQMMNDRYGITNAKIKDYYPGYTYTPRLELPKYLAVSSEGYKPIGPIKEVDEWLDASDMWNMCIKRYTDAFSEGVAIVKEEKDMKDEKKDETKDKREEFYIWTPSRSVRYVKAPEAIVTVHYNEKKGITTIKWIDGSISQAKCGPNDTFDREKGLETAFMNRFFPDKKSANDFREKWGAKKKEEEPSLIIHSIDEQREYYKKKSAND